MMKLRTCIDPAGYFKVGIHQPQFEVENLRENVYLKTLGTLPDGTPVDNQINFPKENVREQGADQIYEIANPFPFRGATFINSAWADSHAGQPGTITIALPSPCSLFQNMEAWDKDITLEDKTRLLNLLPHPLCIALAQASTDPKELVILAQKACTLLFKEESTTPQGIGYKQEKNGNIVPDIHDHKIFEVVVNNPHLPDAYKKAMVLRPGVQGKSEIIGEFKSKNRDTHVFEYLRRNSYIPWGHYASNMADDAIRYRARDLTIEDMKGLRHLYYQRTYVRMANQLGITPAVTGRCLGTDELEALRKTIVQTLESNTRQTLTFNRSLWGWNFGFGFAQSGHRLHASHQMIHQQNSLVPKKIIDGHGDPYDCFSWGDLVTDFITEFKKSTGKNFFDAYLSAIRNNERTDQKNVGQTSLIVHEDDQVILFVPKAQVSEWELCLMTKNAWGNILETDISTRNSLDQAILTAIQTLESLGAQMVTAVELSGRFDNRKSGQHLVYSFIPRLPHAPGTFSEAQLRWISGCYPEDFAHACRRASTH
ncbi:MAG: hypothetical protein GY710_13265 [Desulfobacteraceae bacterium]|nr:hypothetical protein [Desulfobacteraceae bacterium]